MAFNEINFGLETSDIVGLTPDQRTAVEFQMVFSVSDRGSQLYENFRYPRFRNFYGWCQVMSGAFVVQNVELLHINQEIVHFRDEVFGLTETIGCYAKAIVSALTPPGTLVTNSVLTRQRITSVRFRLLPGVKANVSLVWETGVAKCDGNVLPPDPLQGQPPAPNNSNSGQNPRPSGQGGDNNDPSANDGNYNPTDGLPPPPEPTESALDHPGQWYIIYSGYNAGCQGTYSARRYALPNATNGRLACTEGAHSPGTCGGSSYNADVLYGGAFQFRAADVTSQTFEFVPGTPSN